MAQNFPTTKSIDVGSMFLMDLSVHESELNLGLANDCITSEEESFFPVLGLNKSSSTYQQFMGNNPNQISSNRSIAYNLNNHNIQHLREIQQPEYLSNSLDRLASAINATSSANSEQLNSVTIVEPQPPPDIVAGYQSSLSDESFVASSGDSLSASYTASSEAEEEERGSATREDSGVLDMKDLDSQLNNSYDNEHEEDKVSHHNYQPLQQEKPISNNIMATNLINKSAITNHNHNNSFSNHPNNSRLDNKPTNGNHTTNNNYHHRGQSKRSMSASLPIQVPTRQMKKDLNKLKLGLLNKNLADNVSTATAATTHAHGKNNNRNFSTVVGDDSQSSVALDDVDEFLEQEYNENHHNHYPIDEYDEDHLRADENPMKLFASIQALARSLHEDTELFGSLPPKRMLESPIRSLALV